MGAGSSVQRQRSVSPKVGPRTGAGKVSPGNSVYGALSDYYLSDLKTTGLNHTEVFDALKRKEEHMRLMEKKKRLSTLQSGSIKVLALNQLSINLKSNDEVRKIGFHSEKISKQLQSAKETVSGLKSIKSKMSTRGGEEAHHKLRLSDKMDLELNKFDEQLREAETQVTFLTHVQLDLAVELEQVKKHSEKLKKSVKLLAGEGDHKPPKAAATSSSSATVKPFVALRNKPALKVRVNSDSSLELGPGEDQPGIEAVSSGEAKRDGSFEDRKLRLLRDGSSLEALQQTQGGSGYFVSPRGTVRLGEFTIGERGLHSLCTFIIGDGTRSEPSAAQPGGGGGFIDFLEVCLLGCGASATVKEAIHVPSFTLVALKMMPIYNQEKRKNVGRELAVLYRNLAELSLVDESLESTSVVSGGSDAGGGGGGGTPSVSRVSSTESSRGLGKSQYVLALYDAFANPKSGLINLVVEYMDGGSLADLVANGGCQDEAVIADIASQVLKGLHFLHSKMQMHRDIKPGNILLNSRGQVKLADFGISKALSATVGFANSFVGTVTYMSPERITGASYSYPSDIWSIGLTLLAVCWGRYPLENAEGGYWGLMKSISDDDPPTPGEPFSEGLCALVDACLKKDPTERPTALQLLKFPFVGSVTTGKERKIPKTRRSSEGQLALGKALKGANFDKAAPFNDTTGGDEEEEDVKMSHLYRILDQLQSRAIDLEDAALEGQAARLGEEFLTIRGSRFVERVESEEEVLAGGDGAAAAVVSLGLPPIKGAGIAKWRHLATQLQLPLDVVLLAAKQRISERFLK